jgi:hypothetical protein
MTHSKLQVGTSNNQVVIFTDKNAYIYIDFEDVEPLIEKIRHAKSDAIVNDFLSKRLESK